MKINERNTFQVFFFLTLLTHLFFLFSTLGIAGKWFLPLDDPFIYFRYAERLADLQPFTFQNGEGFSTGSTSPLYPLLIAPFTFFTKTEALPWVTFLFSLVWKSGTAWFLYKAVRLQSKNTPVSMTAGIMVCLSGPFTYAVLNGMETGLFSISLMAFLFYSLSLGETKTRRDFFASVISLSLATMARPESVLIPAALFLICVLFRKSYFIYAKVALLAMVPMALYLSLVFVASGEFTTSTASSKMLTAHRYQNASSLVLTYLGTADDLFRRELPSLLIVPSLFMLLFSFGVVTTGSRSRLLGLLLLLPLSVSLLSVNPVLNDGRYFQPYIPVLFFFWGVGAFGLVNLMSERKRDIVELGICFLGVITVVTSLFSSAKLFSQSAAEMYNMHVEASKYIEEELDENSVIAVHDAGIISALSERRTIDLNGLTSPEFFNISSSIPGGIYEVLSKEDFSRLPTHAASFPSWLDPALRTSPVARFPYPNAQWSAGEPLNIYGFPRYYMTLHLLPKDPSILKEVENLKLVDALNYGDLESEEIHGFAPISRNRLMLSTMAPLRRLSVSDDSNYLVTDAGRLLSNEESFELNSKPGVPGTLILRCYTATDVALRLAVSDFRENVSIKSNRERFQEVSIPIPAEAFENRTKFRLSLSHRGSLMPDALEIYHAWLYQETQSSGHAMDIIEKRERTFERDVINWFSKRNSRFLPIDEEYALFWHRGFEYGDDLDGKYENHRQVTRSIAAMTIPVQGVGKNPRVKFRAKMEEGQFDIIWGYRFYFKKDELVSSRVIRYRQFDQEFEIEIPPEMLKVGLNTLDLHMERIYYPDYRGIRRQEVTLFPDLKINSVELWEMGW